MHSTLAILLGGSMALSQAQPAAAPSAASVLSSDTERAIYAAGVALWRTLAPLKLSPAEIEQVIRGVRDATNGTSALRQAAISSANPEKVAIWLGGYYNGKKGNTVIDTQQFETVVRDVTEHCRMHLQLTLMEAAEAVMAERK